MHVGNAQPLAGAPFYFTLPTDAHPSRVRESTATPDPMPRQTHPMSLPAVLIHDRPGGCLRVAGLSVLERLIVAAHRAGFHPIRVIATVPLPRFRRLAQLGVTWERLEAVPPVTEDTLVASSDVLVTVHDLRNLQNRPGVLQSPSGEGLPVGILSSGSAPDAVRFDDVPPVPAGPVCSRVSDEPSRKAAESALWRSLRSATDGWVDRHLNRPLGRWLSRLLVHTPVSPNQVFLVSILIGIASGWWFAEGEPSAAIVGACLLQLSAIIDCVDGDLARVLFKESRLGRWLDLAGDQFVHLAVFGGIPLGLYRRGLPAPWAILGASCVVGLVLSFAAVVRGLKTARDRSASRLQRFIDATTNRDFSVLLLGLAMVDALEWFVWAAAVGIHLFWMTVLGLQLWDRSTASPPRGPSA